MGHQGFEHALFDEVVVQSLSSAESPEVFGKVNRLSHGVLVVRLAESVAAPSPVRISFSPDCFVNGHLVYCSLQNEAYEARIHLVRPDNSSSTSALLFNVLLGQLSRSPRDVNTVREDATYTMVSSRPVVIC